jgi:hypothetical protein
MWRRDRACGLLLYVLSRMRRAARPLAVGGCVGTEKERDGVAGGWGTISLLFASMSEPILRSASVRSGQSSATT